MMRFQKAVLMVCTLWATVSAPLAGDAEKGRNLFKDSGISTNGVACLHCHDTPESLSDGVLRPAHPMTQVLGRPNYWGGTQGTFDDAVRYCASKYMGVVELGAAHLENLRSYAETLGTEAGLALTAPKRTRRAIADLSKLTADEARGKQLAERACRTCHDQKGPGPLLSETLSPAPIIMVILSTGGKIMPFFTTDRLSDQDVADIASYVAAINRSSK